MSSAVMSSVAIRVHEGGALEARLKRWQEFVASRGCVPLSYHPAWPLVLASALRHTPYCLEAVEGDQIRGLLPLVFLRTRLFGRFLVGLPYLNYGGVMADDPAVTRVLIDRAVDQARQLDVRYLELRHESPAPHADLIQRPGAKVKMQLALPTTKEELWKLLSPKVRNQVRKGMKSDLDIQWGRADLLAEFYSVFSENMRDLGTPVFGRELFRAILDRFSDRAELCVVRTRETVVAGALLLHGWGITEVPSASSLRRYNSSCANMLMYWELLARAIERGQSTFDFGRSSPDSNTYQFKKQWGTTPTPAVWQYHMRVGSPSDMRPDNPRFRRMIQVWQRLPLGLTRIIGPEIVRGIP